jgi:hypothetical protein
MVTSRELSTDVVHAFVLGNFLVRCDGFLVRLQLKGGAGLNL